ncbi:MAG: YifB family Mg chelatase-like AAA ATPase [Spirochaetaceae bacterium]
MRVYGYVPGGYAGDLVAVEVDIRRGIPITDVVGLPDSAVREARERVRAALRKTGVPYPQDHVLVNLAPAGVRKIGAAFDLAIAVAVLETSGMLAEAASPGSGSRPPAVLVLGEVGLDGSVRRVNGVLSAVAAALDRGITDAVVPRANAWEARALDRGRIHGVGSVGEAITTLIEWDANTAPASSERGRRCRGWSPGSSQPDTSRDGLPDFSELQGQSRYKRVLEIAAAGRHNLVVVGPPGSGKTMGVRTLPSLIPELSKQEALEVTRIYSRAGMLRAQDGLIVRPPFRAPHHTASLEGIVGGTRDILPGEISLAHRGVLFLDEAAEFRRNVLQSLREPTEQRSITIARAGRTYWYPADFQLIMAANPCPCGYFGHPRRPCSCSMAEVSRYWKRLGGPLMDRIDLRIRIDPAATPTLAEPSATMRREPPEFGRVREATMRQRRRFEGFEARSNASIPAGRLREYLTLGESTEQLLQQAARKLSLSSRAVVSVLRVARTIADLAERQTVERSDLLEAVQHRRLGEGGDWF